MKVSVVICTYNRAGLLEESIISVQNQDYPAHEYEIIVVDNNSSDNTKEVVEALAGTSKVKIKYVFEKQQGLSHARNAGIKGSEGELLAFTDDDVEAEPQWLRELVSAFDDPDAACAGGPIRPIWLGERPDWLTDRWLNYYAVSEFAAARETGEFKKPDCPWGANIAFRRGIFETAGLFPTDLGRKASCLLSNEEIQLCREIEKRSKKILFASNAVVHHKISPERLRKLWLFQRRYWQGRSDAVLDRGVKANVYARLRQNAALMVRLKVEKRADGFEDECLYRSDKGYLHQLLSPGEKNTQDFRGMRVLETYLAGVIENAAKLVAGKNDRINELTHSIEEERRKLTAFGELLKEKDEKIKKIDSYDERLKKLDEIIMRTVDAGQKEEELRKKAAQLTALESDKKKLGDDLSQMSAQLTQQHEQLIQKEEQIRALELQAKEKDTQFMQKCEEMIEVENRFKIKCVEVVSKDKELMQACEERSGEKQRFEEALKQKDNHIQDLLNSMSWKITAPLRVAYELVLQKKGVSIPIMKRVSNYLPDPQIVKIERSLMWKLRFEEYSISLSRKFKDIHKDKVAFLVGSGPSVRLEDLQYLKNYVTFVCNRFYLCYDRTDFRPTYLLSSDPQMVGDFGKEMSEKAGCPVFFNTAEDMVKGPNVYWIPSTYPHRRPLVFQEKIHRGIFCGGATLVSAVQIAYFMGIRKFYLYGVDHSFKFNVVESKDKFRSAEGDQNHFIPNYRSGKRWCPPATEIIEESFQICDAFLRERGGFIKNATRGGQLEVLERVDFDEVVGKHR